MMAAPMGRTRAAVLRLFGRPSSNGGALTETAPHVRAIRDASDVYRAWLIALLPCTLLGSYNVGHLANLAAARPGWRGAWLARAGLGLDAASPLDCLARGVLELAPLFLVALAVGALWEWLFASLRGRELLPGLGALAALYTLLLPPELPLWQAALGMSFGVVVGKEILGGTGMHVVHPVVVALVFLSTAYPANMGGAVAYGAAGDATLLQVASAGGAEALAAHGVGWWNAFVGTVPANSAGLSPLGCCLGAAWLVVARVASWRVMAGALLGITVSALLLGGLDPRWQLVLGSFAFGAVFLATDPASGTCTRAGRWLHGLLLGFLVVLIRTSGPGGQDGTVAALLLGSVLAPLIDQAVLRAHGWRRARRAGGLA